VIALSGSLNHPKDQTMTGLFEKMMAGAWNRIVAGNNRPHLSGGLNFGTAVVDGNLSRTPVLISHIKRTEHIATLGKTGTGKTSLLKYMVAQDIAADRGFVFFDHHGDTAPYILARIAEQEQKRLIDLSPRLIVIEPGDRQYSVGLNVLEHQTGFGNFNAIEEFSQILKQRWHLESFGARTEELLRNALCVLADCHLTVLELAPLLSNAAFRADCVRRSTNEEVRSYFEDRYDRASEPMQAVYRDAILNKVTAFTADPHFRHILGQSESSFSLVQAIDNGYWIILNLDKGRLGEQAATLGSLFLTKLKNALFSRQRRNSLFTLYCDEMQNLVAYGSGLETLLSEARKFGVSVVSANQFFDQHPAEVRSALLAVGTHVCFQLSSTDAEKMAAALDGGKPLAELLRNLPQRHIVVKSGHQRWIQATVPEVVTPRINPTDLHIRCRVRWAKSRTDVEREIRARQVAVAPNTREALNDWE